MILKGFVYGILPEIIGKWYTRSTISNKENIVPNLDELATPDIDENNEDYEATWCYCNQPCHGNMIFE